MAVRAAGGVRAAAVAAWNAAKARPKQIADVVRGNRDSVRGMAARVKALTSKGCFAGGTPILTPGGSKPIERIRRGDLVQSRDPETGRSTVRRVLQAIRRSVDSVITLELASAKGGPVLQRLTGTPDHPIFTPRGQVPLSALGIGTEVISRAGPNLVVRGIIRRHEPGGVAVYNLDVEGDHTYFVGASAAAWVHNGGPCLPHAVSVPRALSAVRRGLSARVSTRAEAEEIVRYFAGYKNLTGESAREAHLLTELYGNPGFYHWADTVDDAGGVARVIGHTPGDIHGILRHVQFHSKSADELAGEIVRVFYGSPVR